MIKFENYKVLKIFSAHLENSYLEVNDKEI